MQFADLSNVKQRGFLIQIPGHGDGDETTLMGSSSGFQMGCFFEGVKELAT